jgi:pimeloyl-ACP methyl ester carboxylesterase
MVTARGEELDAITAGHFDIVGWDLRGTLRSTAATCFATSAERDAFWQGLAVPTTRSDEQTFLARSVAMARRCGERNGSLLAHVSVADTVRDLDHLRRLVGDRYLNFFGESAGTFVGQTYANMFPKRVRAMALDGVVDAVAWANGTAAVIAHGLDSVDAEFDQFLALCEQVGPDVCPLAGAGPVKARVERLLAGLRRQPIPAPFATPPGELTYGDLLSLIKFAQLPHPDLWPAVGALLVQAEAGDASALEDLANGYAAESTRAQFETNTVLLCGDSWSRQGARAWPHVVDELEAISRFGGAPMGWVIGSPCASWPVRGANRYTGPWNAVTAHPILLIGTRFDPNTPLVNAQRAERRLGNAVLLTHDGYGHLSEADPSACVKQALGRYLVELTTPARGTVCPSDRLPFDPEFGQPLP